MTPEPTLGVYAGAFADFMRDYGYDDTKGRAGRRNFGGVYRCGGAPHARTTVCMRIEGYNAAKGTIDDMGGKILLVDPNDAVAAGWDFANLLNHWNRKHAKAAYVPSESTGKPKQYRFGDRVKLGTGTDFFKFMRLAHSGQVYLDPAVKIEGGKQKKRNQFRVNHSDLPNLYDDFQSVSLI